MLFPGILCDKMYHEKNIQEVRNTHSSGSQEEGWNWELLKKKITLSHLKFHVAQVL